MRPAIQSLLRSLGAVGLGLVVLTVTLGILGYDPIAALGALGRGAFGSWYAWTSATLVRAVPLIVVGLGMCLAFRAGALNIGGEGQFAAGAIAATAIGLSVGSWPAPLAWLVVSLGSVAAGMAWVLVPVGLKLRFGVLEVITTLLLNFVAEGVVSLMVQGPLQEPQGIYPQSAPIPASVRLPVLPGTRLHLGFVIAVVLAVLLWLVISRSRWGFRLRAVGESPAAAAVAGRIPVARVQAAALIGSAGLAGLAGGLEVSGVTYTLYQNLSPGYGFTGIAVALVARLHPLAVIVAGLGFGALEAGASGMQRDAGIPSVAVNVVQATIIVLAMLSLQRGRGAQAEASA
ncbi:MAG: ABC transporter permease [Gemmatimonadales bacterium]